MRHCLFGGESRLVRGRPPGTAVVPSAPAATGGAVPLPGAWRGSGGGLRGGQRGAIGGARSLG